MRIYGGLINEKCLPQTRVFWGALTGEAMEPSEAEPGRTSLRAGLEAL